MAKRKASAKKPGTRKKTAPKRKSNKSSQNKSTNYGALGVLIVLLLATAVYAVFTISEAEEPQVELVAEPHDESSSAKKATEQKKSAEDKGSERNATAKATEEKKNPEVDGQVESPTRNDKLPENDDFEEYYYTSTFDFAWPAYDTDDQIIEHGAYTLCYDEKTEQAKWVAYKLTRENLSNKVAERKDNFREDPMVNTGSAELADYKKSGYDRGHLAPAADFAWSEDAMSESFFMSNMSPQTPSFNRGIWKKLEERVRDWADEDRTLYVVTGPLFHGRNVTIGKNKVAIPKSYFKAVLDINPPEVKAIGFIMPNAKLNEDLLTYAVPLDDIEKQARLDLFPVIPDELEERLEGSIDKSLWRD